MRVIAIMAGGILFGPWVGIVTGIVAGVHRYLIDIGGITSVPCLITSIIAGISAGYINLKVKRAALARRHRRRHAVRIPHHAVDRCGPSRPSLGWTSCRRLPCR